MPRLFWKFFAAIFISLLLTGTVVGYTVSLFYKPPPHGPAQRPMPEHSPHHGGAGEIDQRSLVEKSPFTPPPPPHHGPDDRGPPPPIFAVLAGLLASMAASALLAWHLTTPLRHLRWAMKQAETGQLGTRVNALMAGRRDEVADLGADFDRMAHQLEQLVESQRTLIHDVSHELRSPLARIQALVGLAHQAPESALNMLSRIEKESEKLDQLIGELLTLSRLTAGPQPQAHVRFDVTELLDDIAADAAIEAEAAGITLQYHNPCGMQTMHGRPELLQRAFENIIRNALKHSHAGQTVEVNVTLQSPDMLLKVEVKDMGPGIPSGEQAAVMQPFKRGRNARPGNGFGLGLPIAQRALAFHHGQLELENQSQGGLRVTMTLPILTAESTGS